MSKKMNKYAIIKRKKLQNGRNSVFILSQRSGILGVELIAKIMYVKGAG